jgi:POT family proton-dependent oligopeptide transporter
VVVQSSSLVGWMLAAGAVATLGYLGWYAAKNCGRIERERLLLALVLICASSVFWALYEQGGSSLNQFAQRNVDLHLWAGQSMTAAQAQVFQSLGILVLAPASSALWAWLGTRNADPNPVAKFAVGLAMVGASFFLIIFGARFAGPDFRTPLLFLAVAYTIQTAGELCLSPVGLSQMTKLAPAALISTMVATWFLGIAGSQWVGGRIAALTSADTVGGQVLDPAKSLATYNHVFAELGVVGLVAGLVMFALSPWLKHWAHPVTEAQAQQPEPIAPAVGGELQAVNPEAARADRRS